MKYLLLCFLFISTGLYSFAQFGINVGYKFSEASQWQIVADNYISNTHRNILQSGSTAGIDYTFPSKLKFLKIQPNIQFTKLASTLYHYQTGLPYDYDLNNFSFQLNTNFYIFLFNSKELEERNSLNQVPEQRGIFIQISPAIDHFRPVFTYPTESENGATFEFIRSSSVDFAYSIGISLGFDMQLTKLLSVSPFVGFRYFSRVDWKDLTEITTEGAQSGDYDFSSINQFKIGIRIGFDLETK